MLSRNKSRISARCDSIVLPCSTISMVINPYEIRNRMVNNGSHPRFFAGVVGVIGTALISTDSRVPNNVVKSHPGCLDLQALYVNAHHKPLTVEAVMH